MDVYGSPMKTLSASTRWRQKSPIGETMNVQLYHVFAARSSVSGGLDGPFSDLSEPPEAVSLHIVAGLGTSLQPFWWMSSSSCLFFACGDFYQTGSQTQVSFPYIDFVQLSFQTPLRVPPYFDCYALHTVSVIAFLILAC